MKYLAFYDIKENESQNRIHFLPSSNKIKYICECIDKLNMSCQIISLSGTKSKTSVDKKTIEISENIMLQLPKSFGNKNKVVRILDRYLIRITTLFKLLKMKRNETLIVYHTPATMPIVYLTKKIKKVNLVLEVEEIYGDVWGKGNLSRKEMRYFNLADKYIFPTELLNEKVNTENKPYTIIHGTYRVEEDKHCSFNDNKTHIVYAGTLDPRKGCLDAVKSAEYLDESYEIHILGFGTEKEKKELFEVIDETNKTSKCKVSFGGLLSGDEYIEFIQSCHIGLCTQTPDAAFTNTSFPSKVLSYMTNGLRVVSVRIKAIEKSAVGDLIYYYDDPNPETIANVIKGIDYNDNYDGRKIIKQLDITFTSELNKMLEIIK